MFREPSRNLLPRGRIPGGVWRNFYTLTSGHQCPSRRIVKLKIKVGHSQATVWIPSPAGTHIQQTCSCFGENFSAVVKSKVNAFSGVQLIGKDDQQLIIAANSKLRALNGRVVNK